MPTAIACVQLTGDLHYVARACDYRGYLVQQRYYGLGKPSYMREHGSAATGYGRLWKDYPQYQAYWHPFLNPKAVQQAGFEHTEVMAWAQAHPDAIFDHPTFAQLCLRWGSNTHGVEVIRLDTSLRPGQLPPLYFTPHTCWVTGTTFFQLASFLQNEDPIILALQEQAGLAVHIRIQGEEGKWRGWYTTDRAAAEKTLQQLGYSFALDQRQTRYFVSVYAASGQEEGLAHYVSLNEAKAHFASLPARVGADKEPYYPRANRGIIETLGGQNVWAGVVEEKTLDTSLYQGPALCAASLARGSATPFRRVFGLDDFSTDADPSGEEVPTLGSLLAATGRSRDRLAGMLHHEEELLCQWERDPGSLTLTDLISLAELLESTPAQLVKLLHEELQAKKK